MKRYLLFAWENYEAKGGAEDFIKDYVSLASAEMIVNTLIDNRSKLKNGYRAQCGNILDTHTGEVKYYGLSLESRD